MKKIKIIFTISIFILLIIFTNVLYGEENQIFKSKSMSEAIYALQVAAGLKSMEPDQTIDFRQYFPFNNGQYLYTKKGWDSYYEEEFYVNSYVYSKFENYNGRQVFVQYWFDDYWYGWKDFYTNDNNNILYMGWHDSYSTELTNPSVLIGNDQMKIGQEFPTIFYKKGKPYWNKYKFCGFETVQTPAGVFENCIKISKINSITWGPLFLYYAKNIGLVKEVYTSTNWYISELKGVKTSNLSIPDNFHITTCENTWKLLKSSQVIKTGSFVLNYCNSDAGYTGALIISDYPDNGNELNVLINSQDGIDFIAIDPYENITDEFNLSVSGNNLSGSYEISEDEILFFEGECN